MANDDDLFLSQLALSKGFIRPEDLTHCQRLQENAKDKGGEAPTLQAVLVDQGFLTQAQVNRLMTGRGAPGGPKTIGPYEIEGKLGEGGMGAVFKAKLRDTNIRVALKVLPAEMVNDKERFARFQREARLGQQLIHPHIVRTMDFGEDDGLHFITLELVEGGDLLGRLEKQKRLPEAEALAIVRDVAKGLQAAHERGLVHRDIKPANIMFDRAGTVKLSDFGLVKGDDAESTFLTQTGVIFGTPHYIAPEQATNSKGADIRADIYALGATLYHMVTGRTPYEGQTAYEVVVKHATGPLTPPRKVHPELSAACERVILRMMAMDPAGRYATPDALAEDLERTLRGEAPAAAAPGLREARTIPSGAKPAPAKRASGAIEREETAGLNKGRAHAGRFQPARPSDREERRRKDAPLVLWLGAGLAFLFALLLLYFFWPGARNDSGSKRGAPTAEGGSKGWSAEPVLKTAKTAKTESAAKTEPVVPPPREEPWTDLIPRIRPGEDAPVGTWAVRNGELELARGPDRECARLALGPPPGPEFDVRIEFTVAADNIGQELGEVGIVFCKDELEARLGMWCRDFRHHAFIWDQDSFDNFQNNPTPVHTADYIPKGRRLTALLEVRQDDCTGTIDGQRVRWNRPPWGQYVGMQGFSLGQRRGELGLCVYQTRVIFHRVQTRAHRR